MGSSSGAPLEVLSLSDCQSASLLNRLNAFHHRCIRSVLGITNKQQLEQHITSGMTIGICGETLTQWLTR